MFDIIYRLFKWLFFPEYCNKSHVCVNHGLCCQKRLYHDGHHRDGCLSFNDEGLVWFNPGPNDPGGDVSPCD